MREEIAARFSSPFLAARRRIPVFTRRRAADLLFWLTRRWLMPLMIPAGITVRATAGTDDRAFAYFFGIDQPLLEPPGPITVCVFTVTMLLAYDLVIHLYSCRQHKDPHCFGSCIKFITPRRSGRITKDRVHPLDELIPDLVAYPVFASGSDGDRAQSGRGAIFGINVYVMRNLLMMDFRPAHAHPHVVRSADHIVLCPHWHQVHHSIDPKHFRQNFGLGSRSDRFFRHAVVPHKDEDFKYG